MWHLFVLSFFKNMSIRKYCQNIDDWTQATARHVPSTSLPQFSEPVDLLTPVSAAVLYHTRFSYSFIPDFFSSMQNLYTFSIKAPASSLCLHTSRAILLSEVAIHVHNTSEHAFFCKHVNREKFLLLCESKK